MTAPAPARVLVVDDEVELMRALCDSLGDEGFRVKGASDAKTALAEMERGDFDLLLSDLMMPGMDGIALLREALQLDPNLIGLIMTGHGTVQTAVEAMKVGAFDYILKPFKLQAILPILARAMDVRRLKLENVRLKAHIDRLSFESTRLQMVGAAAPMKKVLAMIEKVAPTEATVLIRGASGSGKELVAHALHHNSPRRDKPLVTINCAAIQETLLESELFGHERGAFTGAGQFKPGLFEVAEGGSLFIDEIAEMSPGMQAKLLRILEDGSYRRVGGIEEHKADVRVIAATNKPLEAEQKAGRFREDLYYRLNVITIVLPRLHEHREDVPALVEHFLSTRRIGRAKMKIAPAALAALVNYNWPGNVRELANVIERAQILAEGDTITTDDLPETITDAAPPPPDLAPPMVAAPISAVPAVASPTPEPEPITLRDVEKRHVQRTLQRAGGNKVHASRLLGISRRALYRLIEKYKLELEPPPGR